MGSIIILDENTINKIAAGEVVERPASVIKELVENAIDAGASSISVEIRNGGISFIRVTDNGSGMSEDDVGMAFERHATSKIRRADDLESIMSMGFRGEALASIAAVSSVQLVTRLSESVQGISITVRGGAFTEAKPAGCPAGTSITVRELFFNTPARYKFLKKDSTEAGYITDILSRISLSHPDISFTLANNGKKVLHTPGNGDLRSTVFSVYGAETTRNLLDVSYDDQRIRIEGFIGKPEIARSNRNHQSVYINKRYIRNKTITSAIDAAYSTFLMKNRHPFVLLKISINPSNVDVNVHPSKMEVKFSNEQDVFRAVYHAVNSALLSQSQIRTVTNKISRGEKTEYPEAAVDQENKNVQDYTKMRDSRSYGNNGRNEYARSSGASYHMNERQVSKPAYTQEEFQWVREGLEQKRESAISGNNQIKYTQSYKADSRLNANEYQKNAAEPSPEPKNADTPPISKSIETTVKSENAEKSVEDAGRIALFDKVKIIGQAFSTYILLEGEDELYLLDQHAAHERIRYEKLKKAYEIDQPFSQMLMSVINVDLTSSEYQFAMSEADFFTKLGFTFEGFGTNSVILRSVPFVDHGLDIKESFLEILEFVMNGINSEKKVIADEALYRMACKSAVKAHKKLDEKEIEALLQDLSSLENPYTCPHGRPAILKLRRYELEKLFKRIV